MSAESNEANWETQWRVDVDNIRYHHTKDYLKGVGMEIGAGAYPQKLPKDVECHYFDIRNKVELEKLMHHPIPIDVHHLTRIPEILPNGADFLIAHQVLEHTSNPIKVLMKWNSYVKNGGVVALSLPNPQRCPDGDRILVPFQHILFDYLLDRNDESFESIEHIFSFIMAWFELFSSELKLNELTLKQFTEYCLSESRRKGHDFHWHPMSRELGEKIIGAASILGNHGCEIVSKADIDLGDIPTLGDIILVYRVLRDTKALINFDFDVKEELHSVHEHVIKWNNLLSNVLSDPAGDM